VLRKELETISKKGETDLEEALGGVFEALRVSF
jgi:hypothetical protein